MDNDNKKKGYQYTKKGQKEKAALLYPMEVFYINLASVYCYKGNSKKAFYYLKKCCHHLSPELYAAYEANIETIKAQAYFIENNLMDAYKSALIASNCYLVSEYILEAFPAYMELATLFLELEHFIEAKQILDKCKLLIENMDLPGK